MERVSIDEASRTLPDLVDRVVREGVSIDLESDHHVVARLSPASAPKVTVAELSRVLASLPSLGEDVDSFARDVAAIRREVPKERNPWE